MKNWDQNRIMAEVERIERFIKAYVQEQENIVVPISGGLDSDVVARLCNRSVGKEHVRLFIVVQSDMESKFLRNARELAQELGIPLAEIHLEDMNQKLISALEEGESDRIFRTDMMLDPAKAKCSVRSSVISCYQDKGFLIAGTTNRTEKELGFFLTFGDNLANFKPIAHLYKMQVRMLAEYLGTSRDVIDQASSAGFWEGQTDMEDIAYWIVNDGPIVYPRTFSDEEIRQADKIKDLLTDKAIEQVLELYGKAVSTEDIMRNSELPEDVVVGILHIVEKAKVLKNRNIMVELEKEI